MRHLTQLLGIILLGLILPMSAGCYASGVLCISLIENDCESYPGTTRRVYSGGSMYYIRMAPPVTIYPGGR